MEIKKISMKLTEVLKKYRYAIVIVVIGILLMSISPKSEKRSSSNENPIMTETTDSMEERMAEILEHIEGVGKVKVMLTESSGAENVYQTDDEYNISDTDRTEHKDTVIITDSDRNESALIKKTYPPKYLGAIIVCQGADSPTVRLALVDAVSKITGLGSDSISVLKMK